MNGVLRTLSLAALVSSLSFSPLPAKAGHYDVAYTGGQWANYLSSGYYSLTSGLYGAVQGPSSLQWASCSGTITATFTWVPDDVGDIPPKTAVLYQRCSAGATAMGDSPTATANNGLGDEPQVWQTETYISVTSSGEHYTIKPNPGTSFSVSCGASAYSACAGFISSSVLYEARAIPVILNLGGAIKANDGSFNILVGQGCTGSISAGEITLEPIS